MTRTTSAAVEAIIEVDSAIALDPFIEIASMLVTQVCVPKGYDAETLERIERWLSAHFYTNRDMRATSESAGPVSASYQHKEDLGFDSSHYGQTAMRVDYLGALSALNQQAKKGGKIAVSVAWAGSCSATSST